MKCGIVVAHIWVFTVCQNTPFKGFHYTKGKLRKVITKLKVGANMGGLAYLVKLKNYVKNIQTVSHDFRQNCDCLAHCGRETTKRVPWQTVKTQMKCCILQHFIRVCTVLEDKNDLQRKRNIFFIYFFFGGVWGGL